jgi:hypothetical protein
MARAIIENDYQSQSRGGGIKNTNKTKVNLTIQNFELNNLTLDFKNAIKVYEYFKNKYKFIGYS